MKKWMLYLLALLCLVMVMPNVTVAAEDEIVHLSVFHCAPKQHGEWKWGDDMVTQYITEKLGIVIDFTYSSTGDNQELYTMLASGKPLPDYIRANNATAGIMMIEQGFVLPLTQIAQTHYPAFNDALFTNYEKINAYSDGELYFISRGYNYPTDEVFPAGKYHTAGFCVNMPLYEQIGSPAMTTLDEMFEAAALAKEAGVDYPVVAAYNTLSSMTNTANLFQMMARLHGGTNPVWVQEDGSVLLNARQDAYIKGLRYVNKLYLAGLFLPENFTLSTNEQWYDLCERGEVFVHFGHPWNIFQATAAGQSADAMYWPMFPPAGEGIAQEDIRFADPNSTETGSGTSGISITKDCKNIPKALEYLAFLMSPEGDLLIWEGIEDVTYYYDEAGVHRYTQARIDMESTNPGQAAVYYGYRNENTNWVSSDNVNCSVRHLRAESQPPYGAHVSISYATSNWERAEKLAAVMNTEEDQLLWTRIEDAWKNGVTAIIFAESEAAFDTAYQKMLADMEMAGLAEYEAILSEQYAYWAEQGV